MKRLAIVFTLLLSGLILAGLPQSIGTAAAGEVWCWDDPVIEVDGVVISINLGVRQSDLAAVTGAEVVVSLPSTSSGRVLYIDTTYFTPVVRFVPSDTVKGSSAPKQFTVTVNLAASRPLDYQIIVERQDSKTTLTQNSTAFANQPTSLVFSLP